MESLALNNVKRKKKEDREKDRQRERKARRISLLCFLPITSNGLKDTTGKTNGSGDWTDGLRELVALPGNLGLITSTRVSAHNCL